MELLFEIVMCAFLDAAMLMLFCTVFKVKYAERKGYRFLSGTFALGFLCGALSQIIFGGNVIIMLLLALGFMLSCVTFVFTFSERGKHDESC